MLAAFFHQLDKLDLITCTRTSSELLLKQLNV